MGWDPNVSAGSFFSYGDLYLTSGVGLCTPQNILLMPSGYGNVGIGTTSPQYSLTIAPHSGIVAAQTVFIQDATPTTGGTNVTIKQGAAQASPNYYPLVSYTDTSNQIMSGVNSAGGLFLNVIGVASQTHALVVSWTISNCVLALPPFAGMELGVQVSATGSTDTFPAMGDSLIYGFATNGPAPLASICLRSAYAGCRKGDDSTRWASARASAMAPSLN